MATDLGGGGRVRRRSIVGALLGAIGGISNRARQLAEQRRAEEARRKQAQQAAARVQAMEAQYRAAQERARAAAAQRAAEMRERAERQRLQAEVQALLAARRRQMRERAERQRLQAQVQALQAARRRQLQQQAASSAREKQRRQWASRVRALTPGGQDQDRLDFIRQYNIDPNRGYGNVIGAFLNPLNRQARLIARAAQRGTDVGEEARKARLADRMLTNMKSKYRKMGLYTGDMSGTWDPVLAEAVNVRSALTEEDQQAAIERYMNVYESEQAKNVAYWQRRAERARVNIHRILNELRPLAESGMGGDQIADVIAQMRRVATKANVEQAPEQVLGAYQMLLGFTQQVRQQVRDANPGGWRGVLQDIVQTPVLGHALRGMEALMDEVVMDPIYAAQYAARQGGGTGRQFMSGLSAFPGMGFLAGGVSRRDRMAVDTHEERQALVEQGQLDTIGNRLAKALLPDDGLGGARIAGTGIRLREGRGALAATLDAGVQMGFDPLNIPAGWAAWIGRVGRVAREAAAIDVARSYGVGRLRASVSDTRALIEAAAEKIAKADNLTPAEKAAATSQVAAEVNAAATLNRLNFLQNTRRGRSLERAVEKVVDGTFDARDLQRQVPGLRYSNAAEIAAASSKEEALNAFRRAFASGEFDPQITLRRQLAAALPEWVPGGGSRALAAPSSVGLGRRVVRRQQGLFDVITKSRKVVRGDRVRSAVRVSTNAALKTKALSNALRRAGVRFADAYDAVSTSLVGLTPVERLDAIWENIAGNAGLEEMFETTLRQVERDVLTKVAGDSTPTLTHLQQALYDPDFEAFLREFEVFGAINRGHFGPHAAQQLAEDVTVGLTSRQAHSEQTLLKRALSNVGLRLPSRSANPTPKTAAGRRFLESRILSSNLSLEVQEALLRETERVFNLKSNRVPALERRIEALIANPVAADEFHRLLSNQSTLLNATDELAGLPQAGLVRRMANAPLKGAAKLFNSLAEPVSPKRVAFLGYTNTDIAIRQRVEDLDRYAMELGLDDFTRGTIRSQVERIKSEDDLFRTVDEMLRLKARNEGVPEELLLAAQAEGVARVKDGSNRINFARVVDGTVKVDERVHTLAQRGELVYLPDPDDIRRTIREFKAFQQDGDIAAKVRVGIAKPLDWKLFGLRSPFTGADLTIRRFLQKGHRTWKYVTVIPGLQLAALGAGVGFAATEGDLSDKLKGAGMGASIGLLTPLRYILRVPGIEEGMRKYLANGMNVEQFKPHLSRHYTQTGLDRPFTQYNAVRAGDPIGMRHHRLLETVERGWSALGRKGKPPVLKLFRKDRRFLDAYGRVLNNQIHPESDAVAEMFLRHRAGEITAAELAQEFAAFTATDAGRLWFRRLKGGFGGPKTLDEAFARYEEFIGTYILDPEVARARLDAAREYAMTGVKSDVPIDVLKTAQRNGTLPEFIHAENVFRIPRNFKEVALLRERLTSMFGFEGPTTAMNRVPMAKAIYRDEYIRLVQDGVDPRRAQRLAEEHAVEETNRIMFRIDDESRFAAKSDYVFPFQQPREELLRVWAPLIMQNKARAMHMARLAAVAFNNGKEKGMFYEDRYGEWRMKVPGSAWISRHLFNVPAEFDFRLTDLVFFGQGAYGVNIIPSPGGPYWAIASRMFINRNPDWYKNMSPWMREILFPYGANGRLFRPEVSRMWQAWLGEPAPFEFASRQEQENALNRHRIEVAKQLIWRHAQETGDWTWRPTDEEVDKATSDSLKAWAFIGAFFPAGPGYHKPDQAAFDAVREKYTDAFGNLDFIGLVTDHPQWAPWLIALNETDDDGYDAWSRTIDEREFDTITHTRRVKSYSEWREELRQRDYEAKAYRELADIQHWPAHLQQDKYDAWEQKYPDLVQRRVDNYQRDIELMHIEGSLIGQAKEEALDRWRKRYDMSFQDYKRLVGDLRRGVLRNEFDPFEQARDTESIIIDVRKQLSRTEYRKSDFMETFRAEVRVTSRLPVAEQIKYWQRRIADAEYATNDPEQTLQNYWTLKNHLNSLWASAPMQLERATKKREEREGLFTLLGNRAGQNYRAQIKAAQDEAYRLDAIIKEMAAKGQWGATYNALKKKRQALFDLARALKNEWYKGLPDIDGLIEDVKAVLVFTSRGDPNAVQEILQYRKEWGWFLPSQEQATYQAMPREVQEAYIQDLVNDLSREPFTKGKKFWEWLTEFQQDILERNLPKSMVDEFKAQRPVSGGGRRRGYRKRRSYGYSRWGRGGWSVEQSELSYAYAMFRKYNKRGNMKAPAAYKQYLELPNDAALRSAFLKQHPEVAEWIRLGPMANMPPHLAMIVADIMIRYGKWEGEVYSMEEIADIGFAREQLARWNRRGNRQAPEAYHRWLQMPTGVAKAQYLKDHPEIAEWLRLGPMANMPEAYREVVRDIMTRYGLWQSDQDPLGQVISGYYATPRYARDKYLEDHPELVEYWKAIRDPDEVAAYDKADRYFAIQDPTARRMFLAMNPDLQEWFINQRNKSYERFLNQVAIYMGSNPELFMKYLDRQEDILSELFHKFGQAPLIRERYVVRSGSAGTARARTRAAG